MSGVETPRTVGLVPHRDRPQARELAARAITWFEGNPARTSFIVGE